MKEKPINFSSEMVRAILEGRKTQTRRIIKPQPPEWAKDREIKNIGGDTWGLFLKNEKISACRSEDTIRARYQVGQQLWVREQLRGDGQPGNRRVGIMRYGADGEMVLPCASCGKVKCEIDVNCFGSRMDVVWEWKEKIITPQKMPRWTSRITLDVTAVRVERVQDISEEDAKAEGVIFPMTKGFFPESGTPHRFAFMNAWDSIHGSGAWDRNEWVWVYEFSRIDPKV